MSQSSSPGSAAGKDEAALFAAALNLASGDRVQYVRAICGNDQVMRDRLELLLAAHDQPDQVLSRENEAKHPTMQVDPSEPAPDEGVGRTIGRYKLLEKLGEGGCGVVYVAEQTEPVRRRVALKVIKLGMDTKQVVARFEAERQALAIMDHPNIAKVLDAGTTEKGRPFFVMELVRGIRITDYCEQEKVPIKARLNLFNQVCHAIQHAHQKGIIHRDIKPSNVLVTMHDGVPVPKVIDFGIAKATEGRLTDTTVYTQVHQFIGTPAYMSPEQAEMSGLDIDTRSDIYSLGVLLYELLTGETPFDGKELMAAGIEAMRRTIREVEPLRPSTRLTKRIVGDNPRSPTSKSLSRSLRSTIPTDLDWIVMKCLEKDRTRRYETANGLAADLKRHLQNEPVVARPPSATYKLQKAWRRNRLVYGAAAAVALALVAGTWFSTWQAFLARRARNSEVAARVDAEGARAAAEISRASAEKEKLSALKSLHKAKHIAYLADMRVVEESIRDSNISRARDILNEHRPQTGEEDMRNWEWFYFNRIASLDESEIVGNHPGGARTLLSTSGNVFLTAGRVLSFSSSKGQIQLWDGNRLRLVEGFTAPQSASALALANDGNLLAIATTLEIELRSVNDGFKVAHRTTNWVSANANLGAIDEMHFVLGDTLLAISGNGRNGGPSYPLTILDTRNNYKPLLLASEPLRGVISLASSSDGRLLAANTRGENIIVLRLPAGEVVSRIDLKNEQAITRGLLPMAFTDSDQAIVTASDSGRLDLWSVRTGELIRTIGEHGPSVTSLSISSDGTRLASAGLDQTVKIWDLRNKAPTRVLRGHEGEVWGVGFLADGRSLVSCGRDQSIRFWDLRKAPATGASWPLPSDVEFAMLRHGLLVAAGPRLVWRTWDITQTGQSVEPRSISAPESLGDVPAVSLLGGDHMLVLPVSEPERGAGTTISLYKGQPEPKPVADFPAMAVFGPQGVRFNKRTLFVHGRIDSVPHMLVWSLEKGHQTHLIPTTVHAATSMSISPDESAVLLGTMDGALEWVDLAARTCHLWPDARPDRVSATAILRDNRTIFVAGLEASLLKIDWPGRRIIKEVPGGLINIEAMSLSSNDSRLATGDAEGLVKVWDVETMRDVAVLGKHTGRIGDVYFEPDDQTLLSVDPSELRIWRGGQSPSRRE